MNVNPNQIIKSGPMSLDLVTNRFNNKHTLFGELLRFDTATGFMDANITGLHMISADGFVFELYGFLNGRKIEITYSFLSMSGSYRYITN